MPEQVSVEVTYDGKIRAVSSSGSVTLARYTVSGLPRRRVPSTRCSVVTGQQPVSQVKSNDVGPGLKVADADEPDQVIFTVRKDARGLRLEITSTFRTQSDGDGPGLPVSWQVELS